MTWNWELPGWPKFTYAEEKIAPLETQFLLATGGSSAYLKTISPPERNRFIVEILSVEGMQSSKIEGELLDRESLQSSICRHFGLKNSKKEREQESSMAALLCDVYKTFDEPLTHEMLHRWHALLFDGEKECGRYRDCADPMQIIPNRLDGKRVYFEAPPSQKIQHEMTRFIAWYNDASQSNAILAKAAIAHVYFESIHPFEDGNGRIGRVLVEKILSQGVGGPVLIAISKLLEKRKKEYYAELERCNRSLDADHWVEFFSSIIIQAQVESMQLLQFLIQKSKLLHTLENELNERQLKVLLRMFHEGPSGFQGGLSAEKYLSITKTTRTTATRDLNDLVEKGALTKTGSLKHTRYFLNLQKFS